MELFQRRGYSEVSVEDIAAELGIGRTTVFRYFGSKAGIIWRDIDASGAAFSERLAQQPPHLDPFDALMAAATENARVDDEWRELSRARLALISSTPELEAKRAATVSRFAAEVADFLRSRADFTANPALPEAFGYAMASVESSALRRWASGEVDSYVDVLVSTLSTVIDAFAPMMRGEMAVERVLTSTST
jgi:AcrR family transcriptional regulator